MKHNVTVSITVKPLQHFQKCANIFPCYKNIISEGFAMNLDDKKALLAVRFEHAKDGLVKFFLP